MAESQSTRDANAWLKEANANQFVPQPSFGVPADSGNQSNPTNDSDVTGSLDD